MELHRHTREDGIEKQCHSPHTRLPIMKIHVLLDAGLSIPI